MPAALYILSWSSFARYDAEGGVLLESRQGPTLVSPPPVLWSAPLPPHALENVGETDMHMISVEVKSASR